MTKTWTNPGSPPWVPDLVVTDTHLDTHVSDNLDYLGGSDGHSGSVGVGPMGFSTANGTISTASTTFVDITGGSISLTTKGGTLLCVYAAQVANDAAVANTVTMQFDLDGTAQTIAYVSEGIASTRRVGVTMMAALTPAAGAHTVKAQWKVDGNIGYLGQYRQMWAVEIRP